MNLYLVRHGESVSPEIDPNQPLSKEAVTKLESFSNVLKTCNLKIEEIYHSGKLRAKQTAEILGRRLAPKIVLQEKSGLKPNDAIDSIFQEIEFRKSNLMIVSHLPFLQSLLSQLLKTNNRELFRFQPSSILCLEKESYGWVLSWALSPELFTLKKG